MNDRETIAGSCQPETGHRTKPTPEPRTLVRWVRFNLVGQLGFILQLVTIHLLHDRLGLHYLAATGLAVEAAILHNFLWHRAWTWRGRELDRPLLRLVHFHLGSGGVSLVGNLAGMALLVGRFGMSVVPANLCTIAACALVNFWVSDRLIFAPSARECWGTAIPGRVVSGCKNDGQDGRPTKNFLVFQRQSRPNDGCRGLSLAD